MNKKIRYFFIVLSILFIQSSFINLFAEASANDLYNENEVKSMIIYDTLSDSYNVDNIGRPLQKNLLESQSGLQDYTKEYYKQQLNDEQKNVYDMLKLNLSAYNTNEISIEFIKPIVFSTSSDSVTEEDQEIVRRKAKEVVQPALDALIKDNPQIFWLMIGNCKYSILSEHTINKTGKGIDYKIKSITFKPVNITDSVNYKEQLDSKLKEFSIDGSTRYDKLKSIHDQLADLITYDLDAPRAHEAIGALIDGKAVCEGYAKAFKLLCDRENIPCVLVIGDGVTSTGAGGHMWNYVQMENNKWYAVDVTWDDQTKIRYDYFLCGSETRSSVGFGGNLFKESHIEVGDFSNSGLKYFLYPEIYIYGYKEIVPVEIVFEIKDENNEDVTNINYKQKLNLYANIKDAPYAKGKLQFECNGNAFGNPLDLDNAFISIDGVNIPFLDYGNYDFHVKYIPAENEENYVNSISDSIFITVSKSLEGTVTISGDEVFGGTITAIVKAPEDIPLKYTWKREVNRIYTIIEGINDDTYKINNIDDIGAKLIVEVTADGYNGVLTASTSDVIKKASGSDIIDIPQEKISNDYASYTVSFDEIEGAEWSINKSDWQASPIFENIAPNTTKTFYVRMKKTDTAYEGNILEIKTIYFPKIQSEIIKADYNITGTEGNRALELVVYPQIDGTLYKFGNDDWSTRNIKKFEKDDIVNVKVKYPETETHFASNEVSFDVDLSKLKQEAPNNFDMTLQQNDNWQTFTVTIPKIDGMEYSFDGVNFSDQNIKEDCLAGSIVVGYVRFPQKDGYNQSAVVSSRIIIPEINSDIDVSIKEYDSNRLVLSIFNKDEKTKSAVFIVCVYDENNNISSVIKKSKDFIYGSNIEEFNINGGNRSKVKVLLWNNLNDMVPIINYIEQAA